MDKYIKDQKIIDNPWIYSSADDFDADKVRQAATVFLDYQLWQSQTAPLKAKIMPVITAVDDLTTPVAAAIINCPDIGLIFDNFKAGVGYSHARMLREGYQYQGNLHALGTVSCDHLCFMNRCGINAFHLSDKHYLATALNYFADIDVTYQQ